MVTVAPVGTNAVIVATNMIGKAPYVFGAGRDAKRSPLQQLAYDCSSFVSQVYASLGFTGITAQTDGMLFQSSSGQKLVQVSTPQPGDLILYNIPGSGSGVTNHVDIYAGNGQAIGATSPSSGINQHAVYGGVVKYLHVVGYNNTTPASLPPVPVAVAGVPGFVSGNLDIINKAIQAALDAGLDPHMWLGILAHESAFNPNAVNPTSGACGLAQIYPCISGLTPEQNLAEGAKRLKAFLAGCGGDMNCALNKYSGGGGQPYIDTVTGFARLIQASNPNLSGSTTGTGSTGGNINVGTGSVSTAPGNDCVSKCGRWPLTPSIAGSAQITIPDLGCVFGCAMQQLADTINTWWVNWQKEHVANWLFVVGGFVVLAIGVGALVQLQSSGSGVSTLDIAKMAVAA